MSDEELIGRMIKGEVKAHELGALLGSEEKAAGVRRAYLRKRYGAALERVANAGMDYEDASSRNIENIIGAAQVPLSYVEISVSGDYTREKTGIPYTWRPPRASSSPASRGARPRYRRAGGRAPPCSTTR